MVVLKIKFCVIIYYVVLVACNKYCEICLNHTMCKYTVSSPHERCTGFKANLTNNDIKKILDRINERRNYVAMGYLKGFPQAANMKKITWSNELAEIAQRWANQCDESIMPDKKDDCRDLEGTKVGQNIATVVGVNEVNVKFFIDIWFMESLAFRGDVVYYNLLENSKCNKFVQLIWATTNSVGCGRIVFYLKRNGVRRLVDRLVCNFSPEGNAHRRPIYTIGIPATQCAEGWVPDNEYTALCSPDKGITTQTALLRIITLVTSDIDPVKDHNDIIKDDLNGGKSTHHSQKHYVSVLKRDNQDIHWSPLNNGRTNIPREKIHSRLYQSDDRTTEFDFINPSHNQFRKFQATIPTPVYYSTGMQQCTRKSETKISNNNMTPPCWTLFSPTNQCTRGLNKNWAANTQVCDTTARQIKDNCQSTQNICQCLPLTSMQPSPCLQTYNCQCRRDDLLLSNCPMRRILERKVPSNFFKEEYKTYDTSGDNDYSMLYTPKTELKLKDIDELSHLDAPTRIVLHKSKKLLHASERKRREGTNSFKPFWQEDEFNQKQHQLKSIRYTTLAYNKRTRKRKPIKSSITQKLTKVTEPITVSINVSQHKFGTEKFLSFEELLRLRKLNAADINARRADEPASPEPEKSTETETSTSEYTANTPFIRLKHCTRKLTCTWTAASLGNNEGNADIGNRGSRTPPGYVEGCTRTSTCTRDFMNRNKMDTIPTPSTEPEIEDGNDEDYCEKRSLNVRRDSNPQETVDNAPKTVLNSHQLKNKNLDQTKHEDTESQTCDCGEEYLRNKRMSTKNEYIKKRETETFSSLSYGDLFYLVVNKIISNWNVNKRLQSEECPCNFSHEREYSCWFLLIFFIVSTLLV